jgi:hypothetical protein
MALNQDLDAVIVSLKAYAAANTVTEADGTVRAMTEHEALGIAAVRLARRYANQNAGIERDSLAAACARLQSRIFNLDRATQVAEQQNIAQNATAIQAAVNAANIAD